MSEAEARSALLDFLEIYSYFLEERGYTDIDWRTEKPFALDTFAHSHTFKTMVKLIKDENNKI